MDERKTNLYYRSSCFDKFLNGFLKWWNLHLISEFLLKLVICNSLTISRKLLDFLSIFVVFVVILDPPLLLFLFCSLFSFLSCKGLIKGAEVKLYCRYWAPVAFKKEKADRIRNESMDQIIRNQQNYPMWSITNASDSFSNLLELKFICFARYERIVFPSTSWNDCWHSKQLKLIYLSRVKIWLVSRQLELWLISIECQRFHLIHNYL